MLRVLTGTACFSPTFGNTAPQGRAKKQDPHMNFIYLLIIIYKIIIIIGLILLFLNFLFWYISLGPTKKEGKVRERKRVMS